MEMKVLGVTVDQSGGFSVLLSDAEEKMVLPIGIGPFEAQAIAFPLHGETPPRPLTHDLMKSIFQSLDVTLTKIVITNIKDGVFYAEVYLQHKDDRLVIDARPSDAIALAVRYGSPIYVAPRLVEFTYRYEDIIAPGQGSGDPD
ncbi:MAG: bifunctional nuclease family protein [Firmicutes bacterium]|nr:bifunctional nuclease family protein [Bacillota bacterium]